MKYGISIKVFGVFFVLIVLLLGITVSSIYLVSHSIVSEMITVRFNEEAKEQEESIENIFKRIEQAENYINTNKYIYDLLTSENVDEFQTIKNINSLKQEYSNTYGAFVSEGESTLIYDVYFFVNHELEITERLIGTEIRKEIGSGTIWSDEMFIETEWYKKLSNSDDDTLYYFDPEEKNFYIVQILRSVYAIDKVLGENVIRINLEDFAYSLKGEAREKFVTFFKNGKYIAGDTALMSISDIPSGEVGEISGNNKDYLIYTSKLFGDIFIGNYVCKGTVFNELAEFKKIIAIVCLISIIVAFLLIMRCSKYLTNPILRLASMMKSGDISIDGKKISRKKSHDEIDTLYESYGEMIDKIKCLIDEKELVLKKRQETEVTALQLQINPHFLYNVLNSIAIQALGGGNDEIASQLKRISQLLRYNINDMTGEVTVEDEFEFVSMYTDIQKYVYGDGVELDMEVSEEAAGCRIIRCIVQPIVENSILHGDDSGEYKINITVKADIVSDRLVISVADDGNGCNADEINGALGSDAPIRENCVGLLNVSRRIKLTYGEQYGLEYKSSDKGTEVKILLPVNRKDEK